MEANEIKAQLFHGADHIPIESDIVFRMYCFREITMLADTTQVAGIPVEPKPVACHSQPPHTKRAAQGSFFAGDG